MDKLSVYVHTHWDREWYQPFESFRLQLVSVVRDILDQIDSGELPRFYLDGQSIVLEDVLAVAPELRARLESHMAAGKLYAGPWYVLADQMLVGGESLVRNLALGLSDIREFAQPAMIGYCPDTFGHSQDLPRILSGFGIKSAVVWRGVPLLQGGPLFYWSSPDGSRVLTYHLTRGYYQTAFHEMGAAALQDENAAPLADYLRDWLYSATVDGAPIRPYNKVLQGGMFPVGADHSAPPRRLSSLIARLNEVYRRNGSSLQVEPCSLPDYMEQMQRLSEQPMLALPALDGELRDNSAALLYERGFLLYGVLSARLYLKRANRLAEYKLSRLCEPLLALMAATDVLPRYPQEELLHAWKLLLKNHPHDSICGCSVDAVHSEMMTRFARLDAFTDTLLTQAAQAVSGAPADSAVDGADPDWGADRLTVFNLTAGAMKAPVHLRWYRPLGAGGAPSGSAVQIEGRRPVDKLFSGWGRTPYYKMVEEVEGWIWPGEVPPFGSKSLPLDGLDEDETAICSVAPGRLSNGILDVRVSDSGRLAVSHTVPGRESKKYTLNHQLRDVGDGGDSYNFDPLPKDKPVVAELVDVAVGRQGPLVCSLLLTYEIAIPEAAKLTGSSSGKIQLLERARRCIKHRIKTEITLKRGVPILFFDSQWENRSSDHRLEVLFSTGAPVEKTYSENHFSVVERRHSAERQKLPVPVAQEAAPDRFPCQRFFIANQQVFFNTGLPEYGVEGKGVTLTLLRALSWLSKPQLFTRGSGAGPNLPVPEANCLGLNRVSYGWAPLSGGNPVVEAYRLTELYEGGIWAAVSKGSEAPGSFLTIDNPAVRIVAAFMEGEHLFVRLLNVTREPQNFIVEINSRRFNNCAEVTLDGALVRDLGDQVESLAMQIGSNQLLTLRLSAF